MKLKISRSVWSDETYRGSVQILWYTNENPITDKLNIAITTRLKGKTSEQVLTSGFSTARAPGLDFLDSFRTLGDCGVEEPLDAPRSVNQSGDDVDRSNI